MGKYDKDRFLKELAVRYCLAQKAVPFLEVIVPSASDLSDSVETLTDLDVLGIQVMGDGLHRTLFDCKTTNKMSSVNRAFWAAGVMEYAGCQDAFVILKSRAVHNHRLSALALGVDLHDEQSFIDLGKTIDASFPADTCYQASLDRWNALFETFTRTAWSRPLYELSRNAIPLAKTPWSTFRRVVAEMRGAREAFDPEKETHIAIFFDVLASSFVLWAAMARDIRRFYEPTMNRTDFEKVLRYYIWGGKEAYNIRQQMREKSATDEPPAAMELPGWDLLVAFAGLVLAAPQCVFDCALLSREIALRMSSAAIPSFDKNLASLLKSNSRIRQFTLGLADYLVIGGGLPKDTAKKVQQVIFAF